MIKKPTQFSRSMVRSSKNQSDAFWSIIAFLVFILFVLYLGGKVHIEYVLRKTAALKENKAVLEKTVADFRVQINALQSYERIVACAQHQGLVFVRHRDVSDLRVDLTGIKPIEKTSNLNFQMAQIAPF